MPYFIYGSKEKKMYRKTKQEPPRRLKKPGHYGHKYCPRRPRACVPWPPPPTLDCCLQLTVANGPSLGHLLDSRISNLCRRSTDITSIFMVAWSPTRKVRAVGWPLRGSRRRCEKGGIQRLLGPHLVLPRTLFNTYADYSSIFQVKKLGLGEQRDLSQTTEEETQAANPDSSDSKIHLLLITAVYL